jgi:predicted Ser/Thr protein kinase
MSPSPSPLSPGTRVGGYVVEQRLGHGGMGDVYLARDLAQHRLVALKLLPADAAEDPRRRDRLHLEGRVLQSLRHPHICSVYEVGEEGGRTFLAMEYVEGRTLHEFAVHERLTQDRVIEIGCQLAAALEAARKAGVIHRDLKGANVMVLPSGDVKVLDFGLAKFVPSSEQRLMNPVSRPTDPGLIFGTAEFMSPEQALGREVDHRSDLFSLGVILYELLTGSLPFKGGTRMELFWSILNAQPASVSEINPSVPTPLAKIVARLLEKDARNRYQTAERVLEDLRELQPHRPEVAVARKASLQRWVARLGGCAAGIVFVLALLPLLRTLGDWIDATTEASSLYAGSIWTGSESIYDLTSVVDRTIGPYLNWIGNDGRILYTTVQSRGRSVLWLKLPSEAEPRFVIAGAGPATVVPGTDIVYFVRSDVGPGLYRSTLAGASPVIVAPGRISRPVASRDGSTVTFVKSVADGYYIWAVPVAGGEPYQLSPMLASGEPMLSPDLTRVAIQQSDDVLVCDIQTCGNQATLPVTSLLGWTSDGSALVHKGPPGASNIWTTRVTDGTMHQVTKFEGEMATSVVWSADGHRVAVSRQRTFGDFDWFGLVKR